MEEQEEEEYIDYPQSVQIQSCPQDQMIDEGEKEYDSSALLTFPKKDFKTSFDDLLKKLESLNVSQDSENTSTLATHVIEEFFNSTDSYTALKKSFEYIKSRDSNFGCRWQKIDHNTKELIYFTVKKAGQIKDINDLFRRAVEENNDAIKSALICSRAAIKNYSAREFYKRKFKQLNSICFRELKNENLVMIPYLSNVHASLILPILKLQKETGYPLFNLDQILIYGFLNGNKRIISFIIINNLAPNIGPIFQAALAGNNNYLQQASFDIDQLDPVTNLSLLGFAAIGNNIETAKLLIQMGANCELANALHVAAFFGSIEIVKLLIKSGADIHTKSSLQFFKNYSPLTMALKGRHRKIARKLFTLELKSGATALDEDKRTNFEHALLEEDKDIAERLLKSYPQCFPSSSYLSLSPYPSNITPLHIAAQDNWIRIATLLISAEVHLNVKTNKSGYTPLHFAAELGHVKIAKLLLDADAQHDVKNFYESKAIDLARLTFMFGETKRERMNAAKIYKLLYDSYKETLNSCYPEDLSPDNISKKRRLSSVSLKSSSTFMQNKKTKTKLIKKLQSIEEVKALKDH